MENTTDTRENYRATIAQTGRKEFTLSKMLEYGFWPKNLPTPYEQQANEKPEDFTRRQELLADLEKMAEQLASLYKDRSDIEKKLGKLRKEYEHTWDIERIKKDISQIIMKESIERRAERKKQRELEKKLATEKRAQFMADNIIFIGKGYSGAMQDKNTDIEKLGLLNLPVVNDDKELANLLGLEYKQLRFLTYHRDVEISDHYYRYEIPKRSGGLRKIAAPKTVLKNAQRRILSEILEKINISDTAHGFISGRSILTGALVHQSQPRLLVNIDLENFFPTITFQRIRGMFKSFGYSGYISSLLAMICTYCERMPIEVKGQMRYVKTSERILPQGSPASPMITNIICRGLDKKINALAEEQAFSYSRYADDMSFGFNKEPDSESLKNILFRIQKVVYSEGLRINKKKTRFLRPNNRQCVTGIVINNEQPGVPRNWVKKMRAALHNASKLAETGQLTQETKNEIAGMAAWLKAVNAERYEKLITESKKIESIKIVNNP